MSAVQDAHSGHAPEFQPVGTILCYPLARVPGRGYRTPRRASLQTPGCRRVALGLKPSVAKS
jgi:hypothetical protein